MADIVEEIKNEGVENAEQFLEDAKKKRDQA